MQRIKTLVFRFLVVNVVFFSVKLTIAKDDEDWFFNPTSLFYYSTAFFMIMFTWEVNDWFIRKAQQRSIHGSMKMSEAWIILLKSISIMLPMAGLIYYVGLFHFGFCDDNVDPWLQWRTDFLRAFLIGSTVLVFNMMYHISKQKQHIEQRLAQLSQEVTQSKYDSLKSQISPHFLFNSLNILTSLMYQDRDLASDFVSRLASCYRYILDNRDQDLISLDKEIAFLDSFMFMMRVRHNDALDITLEIDVDTSQYMIPTLSLQMLVENALKHNKYSPEEKLHILLYTKGSQRLVVRNNLQERIKKEPSTGVGLTNIQNRYKFYTRQEVIIEQRDGNFTVELPLLKASAIEPVKLSVS
ncbi:sensor histidine kinase [Gilvibacter sediminis]|uniref:sensor histidine kinase n=1 Tax=Gilvibacter sediminis TaxID=379071 RepID=UPI00235068AD|nr:histidine kinase [Gilvibacter sediminis]MDC7997167.1 histidine kinase [Gilvibacter sediminis]